VLQTAGDYNINGALHALTLSGFGKLGFLQNSLAVAEALVRRDLPAAGSAHRSSKHWRIEPLAPMTHGQNSLSNMSR
jgi:hypothetical protein